jgi:hypothetical protein
MNSNLLYRLNAYKGDEKYRSQWYMRQCIFIFHTERRMMSDLKDELTLIEGGGFEASLFDLLDQHVCPYYQYVLFPFWFHTYSLLCDGIIFRVLIFCRTTSWFHCLISDQYSSLKPNCLACSSSFFLLLLLPFWICIYCFIHVFA